MIKTGRYKIVTAGGPSDGHQPEGWGLSAWHAHGAKRDHKSSWVAVHSGNHWPMVWRIEPSLRRKGTYLIKTTSEGPAGGHMPAGWGLSAWHAHGAVRNGGSSRVAVIEGHYWPMDWSITPSTRKGGTYYIKTAGGPSAGHQPAGWGLAAWHAYHHGGAVRNGESSWVYVHSGDHWLMDWRLEWVGA